MRIIELHELDANDNKVYLRFGDEWMSKSFIIWFRMYGLDSFDVWSHTNRKKFMENEDE